MTKATVILLAVIIDLLEGDPPNRFHPVVGMGNWFKLGRSLAPTRHRFGFGAGWVLAGLALIIAPVGLIKRTRPALKPAAPFLLKPMFAYRDLRRAVAEVGRAVAADDLPEARRLLSWHLVSRDTTTLTRPEIIAAAIASLVENLTDSLTAPLLAYAAGGLPAAWAYRLVNTADAMWGYRTAELEQLGKFPARLDDLLNWLPARLSGWLLVLAAQLAGADAKNARLTMLAHHQRTPSPNAGWTMSAIAGACHITLAKQDIYRLPGGDRPITLATLNQAIRLADIAAGLTIGLTCAVAIIDQVIKRKSRDD